MDPGLAHSAQMHVLHIDPRLLMILGAKGATIPIKGGLSSLHTSGSIFQLCIQFLGIYNSNGSCTEGLLW